MARRDSVRQIRLWSYIETSPSLWYDILVNWINKYINFNTISWSSWYWFRDNSWLIEFKDDWWSWLSISWLVDGYIPYTWATGDADMGTYHMTTSWYGNNYYTDTLIADTNNLDTSWAYTLLLDVSATNVTLSGVVAPTVYGMMMNIINTWWHDLIISNQDSNSAIPNQFNLPADITINPKCWASFIYDGDNGYWLYLESLVIAGQTWELQYNDNGQLGNITGATSDGTSIIFTSWNLKVADIQASWSGGVEIKNSGWTNTIITGAWAGTGTSIVWTTNIGSASADYLQHAGGTGTVTQTATWSSTNININLVPKGSGTLQSWGTNVLLRGGALGTPSSWTLTNCTSLPISWLTASTSTAIGVGSIELGHASDTTIARVSAGRISVEWVNVPTISSTDTLTNKTLTSPVINVWSDATWDIYYRNSGWVFKRLAIGSTGNVLTVSWWLPSWSAPSFSREQWVSLSGTFATATTFTTTETSNAEATRIARLTSRCLFTCTNSSGTTRRIWYIKSATASTTTVTYTVVTDSDLASGDINFRITPHRKVEDYQMLIAIPWEQVADASNPQGMYYRAMRDSYLLPVNSFVRTAAAWSWAACAWNIYKGATNLFTSAQDMTTNSTYDDRRPNTNTISANDIITARVTSSAWATNKASDLSIQLFVVPQELYLWQL